jgi:hypothetical protein
MRTVGQALDACYLIDGSVRKAGSGVRITAQLIRADSGVNVWTDSYDVFAIQGNIAEALCRRGIPQSNVVSRQSVEDGREPPPDRSRQAPGTARTADLDERSFVYAYIRAEDRLMEYPERYLESGRGRTNSIWYPAYPAARKMERFKAYVRAAGHVDYWRERGWPDLCRPQGADDFVCD